MHHLREAAAHLHRAYGRLALAGPLAAAAAGATANEARKILDRTFATHIAFFQVCWQALRGGRGQQQGNQRRWGEQQRQDAAVGEGQLGMQRGGGEEEGQSSAEEELVLGFVECVGYLQVGGKSEFAGFTKFDEKNGTCALCAFVP